MRESLTISGEIACEPVCEILATALGRIDNQYRKVVRKRTQRIMQTDFKREVEVFKEGRAKSKGFICGTGRLQAAINRLYYRQARLLLYLLQREGVYIINKNGQVFGFHEIGRKFGAILKELNNNHYKELSWIDTTRFAELNLDDPLIREHFYKRAENFIATATEEGLNFFFIGDESNRWQVLISSCLSSALFTLLPAHLSASQSFADFCIRVNNQSKSKNQYVCLMLPSSVS
jgi:hypothetical protein